MNIQEICRMNSYMMPNYFDINREERNYAAILYASLCKPSNLELFLKDLGCETEMGEDFGIYFEYAYLRDFWNSIDGKVANTELNTEEKIHEANRKKGELIQKLLELDEINEIFKSPDDIKKINDALGAGANFSKIFIQSPGRWSIKYLAIRMMCKKSTTNSVSEGLCLKNIFSHLEDGRLPNSMQINISKVLKTMKFF